MKVRFIFLICGGFIVAAFVNPPQKKCNGNSEDSQLMMTAREIAGATSSWLDEMFNPVRGNKIKMAAATKVIEDENKADSVFDDEDQAKLKKSGRVIRIAARQYNETSSKPSTRGYTTRKSSYPSIQLTAEGVRGDYNHYRFTVLKNTPNRAVSILTTDVMKYVQSFFPTSKEGDLGENLLIEGFEYYSIQVGKRFVVGRGGVMIEITEPMEPCANLCTLPYINNAGIEPKLRLKNCQDFIYNLAKFDGLRGWYAKVITGGRVNIGDTVTLM